jgi:hypothetical protein
MAATPTDTEYYYEPVPGKVVGIWPDSFTAQRLALFRERYGFRGVALVSDAWQYGNALQAGFLPAEIMIRTSQNDFAFAVDNFAAGIYYLDEPVEHDCYGHASSGGHLYIPEELAARRDYLHASRPSSQFAIGGYKRCSHNQIGATYADKMMFSSYKNWEEIGLPFCHVNMGWGSDWEDLWVAGDADQRNSWTAMRNTFGAKFSMTWIHGGGDEYALLFAHANTLGLTGIWQYNGAPIDSARLESFCYAAWQNGWLNRVALTPLPIQLARFTATVTQQHTMFLEWMTLSELNNYGFEVQRRAENETSFSTLPNSFIPGHGTTTEPHTYSFTDETPPGRCRYRLKQIDLDGTIHFGPEVSVNLATGVHGQNSFPTHAVLGQNYPNPFNPTTTIKVSIPRKSAISLKVLDVFGREVATLLSGEMESGTFSVEWNSRDCASGVYFYRLQTPEYVETKKMLLLR